MTDNRMKRGVREVVGMGTKRYGALASGVVPPGVVLVLLLVSGVCVLQCKALETSTEKDLIEHAWEDDDVEFSHSRSEVQMDDFGGVDLDELENEIEEEEEGDWDESGGFEGVDFDDEFDGEEGLGMGEGDDDENIEVDETDVVVLGGGNFSDFVETNQYVLVEFYAPWCGHCKALVPEYAAAATDLKGEALLAKVDATVHDELARQYDVEGYPTLFFFIDGIAKKYTGPRQKDDIVEWVKKKTGPSVANLKSKDDAEKIVDSQTDTLVIALLNSLEGPEVEEFMSAARIEDDVLFYQTDSAEVAEVFNFPEDISRPSLVLLKHIPEKCSWFDGPFESAAIAIFVKQNKIPLVIPFNNKNNALIFESPIKKQVILFASGDDYEKFGPSFREASKLLMGKILFVHVDLDDTEQAQGILSYFGTSGEKATVMGYEAKENGRKFMLLDEITLENVKTFGEKFLEGSLKVFHKSAPIPETNDGDVKVVVGLNLDSIVLDETKDVFLEIFDPWCGHCKALEPTWDKLAKRLKGVDSVVIAKIDGTVNEHDRAKPDGYPTLLFFPAGKKSFDPITYEGDRTVKDFVTFLKREASIPFIVPKKRPNQTTTSRAEAMEPVYDTASKDSLQATKSNREEPGFSTVTEDPFISRKDEL